jgi:type II secretory pathway component GspD/PulD (secretin)
MANDRDYQRVLRVIQGLDVVASQVLIEAVIAEVTLGSSPRVVPRRQRLQIPSPVV